MKPTSRPLPFLLVLSGLPLLLAACSAPAPGPDILAPTDSQLELRSHQTRTYEQVDRQQVLRAVIAVLQDLGFIIERANEPLGLVTAARFAEPSYQDVVEATVTVRAGNGSQLLVRINAIFDNRPVTDPEAYQKFFAALERSLFLTGRP